MDDKKPKITDEDIKKILEALTKAYESVGRKVETAIKVDEIDEEGNITGDILIDNRDDEKIN